MEKIQMIFDSIVAPHYLMLLRLREVINGTASTQYDATLCTSGSAALLFRGILPTVGLYKATSN
jgi:hypothetical protein